MTRPSPFRLIRFDPFRDPIYVEDQGIESVPKVNIRSVHQIIVVYYRHAEYYSFDQLGSVVAKAENGQIHQKSAVDEEPLVDVHSRVLLEAIAYVTFDVNLDGNRFQNVPRQMVPDVFPEPFVVAVPVAQDGVTDERCKMNSCAIKSF